MDQRTRNAPRRLIEIVFSAALVVIVLTACGGDDGDDAATETVEKAPPDEAATPDREQAPRGALVASPADVAVARPGGTPVVAGLDETPATVVAAPPVGATPAESVGGATPAVDVPGVPVTGDGTGGAAPQGAGDSPAGDAAVVDSCNVASYPPYTGDAPAQLTTVDVNFRAGPGTDCDALGGPLSAGTAVDVLSDPVTREGEPDLAWVAVSLDGTEGWLATEFLEPAE